MRYPEADVVRKLYETLAEAMKDREAYEILWLIAPVMLDKELASEVVDLFNEWNKVLHKGVTIEFLSD